MVPQGPALLKRQKNEVTKTVPSGPQKSLWAQLKDPSNPQAQEFMRKFNEYNMSIGESLVELGEQPQDVQGREDVIEETVKILERPITPVGILIAEAGAGKTALVEELAKRINSGALKMNMDREYLVVALRVGNLSAQSGPSLQSALSNLLPTLKKFEDEAQKVLNKPELRILLFIDEVHMIVTIFGSGTKIGGDVIKDVLARPPIRVLGATTKREYDSTIIVDKPLAERFKQIELQQVSEDILRSIISNWWEKVVPGHPAPTQEAIDWLIMANEMYRSDSAEPRRSLDILEDLASYSLRTGQQADYSVVESIFKNRFSINLQFTADADHVYQNIKRRVKGQPFALQVLKKAIRSMVFDLEKKSNKPKMTLLLSGPTGVGKTETVKALAEALYPGEKNVLAYINMPDYKTKESSAQFKRRLGEIVRHKPNSIILLDEIEKAKGDRGNESGIFDDLLVILDEGNVSYETVTRDGYVETNTVSLRNTIVIATTNAGHEVFSDDTKFSQRGVSGEDMNDAVTQAEVKDLVGSIRRHFIDTELFKPEFLGRFSRIIPYRGLTPDALIEIGEIALRDMLDRLKKDRHIEVEINEPRDWSEQGYPHHATDLVVFAAYILAQANDSNSGGARALKREIDTELKDEIISAVFDNPDVERFKAYVKTTSALYDSGASKSVGGIVVEPQT